MIREDDDKRIENLRKKLGIPTKVRVVREALNLLERGAERAQRIQRWKKATKLVSESSREVLRDFLPRSRLLRHD